jgi:hypothetical protein
LYVRNEFKQRRDEYGDPPPGLARRATDTVLRGMKVKMDDSAAAWDDWEEANSKFDELQGEDAAADDATDTQPAPLMPAARGPLST